MLRTIVPLGRPTLWSDGFFRSGVTIGGERRRAVATLRRANARLRASARRTPTSRGPRPDAHAHVPDDPAVLYDVDGHVAIVTINRPEARNAVNPEVLVRLADAWDAIDGNDDVRVAILTGTGEHFCAGADLDKLVATLAAASDTEFERAPADYSLIYKDPSRYQLAKPLVSPSRILWRGNEILRLPTSLRRKARSRRHRSALALFPVAGSPTRLSDRSRTRSDVDAAHRGRTQRATLWTRTHRSRRSADKR